MTNTPRQNSTGTFGSCFSKQASTYTLSQLDKFPETAYPASRIRLALPEGTRNVRVTYDPHFPVAKLQPSEQGIYQSRLEIEVVGELHGYRVDPERQVRLQDEIENKTGLVVAIILWYNDDTKKYEVVDGNNRAATVTHLKHRTIEAIILPVGTTREQAREIARVSNGGHGEPITTETRLMWAVEACANGERPRDAAKRYGVKVDRIENFIATEEAKREFTALGLNRATALPAATQRELMRIDNDKVLKEAARVVLSHGLTTEETKDMVAALNKAGTVRARQAAVKRLEKRYSARQVAATGRSASHSISRASSVLTAIRKIKGRVSTIPSRDYAAVEADLLQARKELNATIKAVQGLKGTQ